MPWSANHLPRYRKHRASGQAIVTINARDYYLGPHRTKASKIEYDRLIAEWLSSGRSLALGSPEQAVTIVELLADYLKYAAGYYGKNAHGEYAQLMRAIRPLRELYGRKVAVEFGVLQFKAVRQHVASADRSRKYVNEIMR